MNPRLSPEDEVIDRDDGSRAGSATLCLGIYLGVVVGFAAVMAEVVRAIGG